MSFSEVKAMPKENVGINSVGDVVGVLVTDVGVSDGILLGSIKNVLN